MKVYIGILFYSTVLLGSGRCQPSHWRELLSGPNTGYVTAVQCSSDGIVYCASRDRFNVLSGYYLDRQDRWHIFRLPGDPNSQPQFSIFTVDPDGVLFYYNTTITSSPQKGGIYRSTDHGLHWEVVIETNCPAHYYVTVSPADKSLYAFEARLDTISTTIFHSTDHGSHWDTVTSISLKSVCYGVDTHNRCYFVSPDSVVTLVRYDPATSLFAAFVNRSLGNASISSMVIIGDSILVRTDKALYRINNKGSWIKQSSLPSPMLNSSSILFASGNGLLYIPYTDSANNYSLRYSDDLGKSWHKIGIPLTCIPSFIAVDSNGALFASSASLDDYSNYRSTDGLFRSTNHGASWQAIGIPRSSFAALSEGPGHSLLATSFYDNDYVYRTQRNSLFSYISVAAEQQWVNPLDTFGLKESGPLVTISENEGEYYSCAFQLHSPCVSLYHCCDISPASITQLNSDLFCDAFPSIAAYHGECIVLLPSKYYDLSAVLLKTTDHGISWDGLFCPFNNFYLKAITIDSLGSLYVCSNRSIFRSNDRTASWETLSTDIISAPITCIRCTGPSTIAVGTMGGGIWKSYNRGINWQQWDQTVDTVFDLEFAGTECFAATTHGLIKCPLTSFVWTQEEIGDEDDKPIALLKTSDNRLYVSLEQHGLWTNDIRYSESAIDQSIVSIPTNSVKARMTHNTLITTITTTTYGHSTIELYDVLGRRVATVGEGEYEMGSKTFDYNMSSLPNGYYVVVASLPDSRQSVKVIKQ